MTQTRNIQHYPSRFRDPWLYIFAGLFAMMVWVAVGSL